MSWLSQLLSNQNVNFLLVPLDPLLAGGSEPLWVNWVPTLAMVV